MKRHPPWPARTLGPFAPEQGEQRSSAPVAAGHANGRPTAPRSGARSASRQNGGVTSARPSTIQSFRGKQRLRSPLASGAHSHQVTGSMKQGYEALTEKEKQTLRLLLAGHDAKSMARHLSLSVHTINERLRDARRKLSAGSSKEAARLLLDAEAALPNSLADKGLGDAGRAPGRQPESRPDAGAYGKRRALWASGGLAMLSLAVALLAFSASPRPAADPAAQAGAVPAAAPAAPSAATEAARQWLELVDAGKWQESWAATAQSFRTHNTVAMWQSASESARVPLGRVLSRRAASEESIPAPPNGYQLVHFQTRFANKPGAIETLSLAREGGSWRVAGYFVE
jgi:DNA-binding CsgD family transcriptional regulator